MNRQIVGIVFALSVCIICVYTQTTTTESPLLLNCGKKLTEKVWFQCFEMTAQKWNLNGTTFRNMTLEQHCCGGWDTLDCYMKEAKAKCNAEEIAEVEKHINEANKDKSIIYSESINGKLIQSINAADCKKHKYGYHESGCQRIFVNE
jgi:hypothetical protein